MRSYTMVSVFALVLMANPWTAAADGTPIPATPEPGAENPAMGPRNSDTGQDDADSDTPPGAFGSGAGSRGAEPGEFPAKSGSGKSVDVE